MTIPTEAERNLSYWHGQLDVAQHMTQAQVDAVAYCLGHDVRPGSEYRWTVKTIRHQMMMQVGRAQKAVDDERALAARIAALHP